MARQSPNRPDADEPGRESDETGTAFDDGDRVTDPDPTAGADPAVDEETGPEGEDVTEPEGAVNRSLWEDVRMEPVEIALPAGAGFTLRAYRLSTELTPTDIGEREEEDPFASRVRRDEEDDDETVVILDEEFAEALGEKEPDDGRRGRSGAGVDGEDVDGEDSDEPAATAEDEESTAEEVPIFLSHRGRLLLFKSPESLVSFIRSGAPNDLTQLDTWEQLVGRIQQADIAPLDEDSYELDLVVENLRGGHDTWDATLLIEAGEVARDLGYALRLPAVLDMLSAGSSLDDLDEALRATVNGGIGGFMGRRRLRKIGAQTASLGWRTIIGKISAVVDWRD